MNKFRPYLVIALCAAFWGLVFSPVLARIDSGYKSVQTAMVFLCAVNVLASLGMKKILKTEIKPGVEGALFSLFYTLVVCALVLLVFQLNKVKYG
jgi:hypothetical protein